MTEKPTALRLADCLEGSAKTPWTREEAAAELRRQHTEIEQLREQNTILDAACTKLDMVRDELLEHLEDINTVLVQRQEFEALTKAARRALEAFPTLDEFFNRYVESIGGPYFGEAARIALMAVRELPRIEGALREALEAAPQPAAVDQKPVAFLHPKYGHMQPNTEHIAATSIDFVGAGWLPLYTTPQPTRQPLTDAGIHAVVTDWVAENGSYSDLCRAVERAHGIGGEA